MAYNVNHGNFAYISISDFYNPVIVNNYVIDINQDNINLDISDYNQGTYIVSLIVNGEITESKTLIKL